MTRVVVQRGAGNSNTPHNRSSAVPSSSTASSQSSQPPQNSPSGTNAEEEIVLEAKEAEPINCYGGDTESLVIELFNKSLSLHGPHDNRQLERENASVHGECSGNGSTSSVNSRENDGRNDEVNEGSFYHVQRHESGRESSEAVELGPLTQSEAARVCGEDRRSFNAPAVYDWNGDTSSRDTGGQHSDWHPPQAVPQPSSSQQPSSSTWPSSPVPFSGAPAASTSIPFSTPPQGPLEMAPPHESDARPSFNPNPVEVVGCSFNPSTANSHPLPSSSSRRNTWVGSSNPVTSRGGLARRGSRASRSSRISPSSSRPASPTSYGECDGYNSEDEQTPWSSGSASYENSGEREHHFEVEIRRTKSLEVRRMAEDGNCLFRAVADQVYGDAEMYDETRQMVIDYMEKERDHFSQFVTESFTAYCKRKRRDKVYGNNLEIQAMAEMYNRPIHIYSYSMEPINIFHGSYETDLPPIRLSYHRGNHYNSLIDPSRPAIGAGLGFGSLRGSNVDREQVKAALKAQQDQQIDKALLCSDLELTEQEIQRMVMEASRAEFYEEAERHFNNSWSEETSTSAAAEPSSSGTSKFSQG
ncbi:hypothetical protein R1sor_009700 [Riccia sorocarpa]|uniref:ubiquitinyl hydrolase 1 n=1 Tax=Riccia sorocarpa TaxID=122646 RepID=A0ABD3HZ89_9MARC